MKLKILSLAIIAILAVSMVSSATTADNVTDEPIVSCHYYLTVNGIIGPGYLYSVNNKLLDVGSAYSDRLQDRGIIYFYSPGNLSDWDHISYYNRETDSLEKYGLTNLTLTDSYNYTTTQYKEIYPNIYTKVNSNRICLPICC
ncbi:MAG: hypothetical protein LBT10_04805 [Methanobrevibacter sp.]|jgi:hypothetical protein|nr:hypothetical protein [Methanobrevibacter sp.]